jgi:arsenate reductase-like glutaredoxin family protein
VTFAYPFLTVIAATSYEHKQLAAVTAQNTANPAGAGSLFSAVLAKPITKQDLTECLAQLGFIFGTVINAQGKSAKRIEGPASRLDVPLVA